MEEKKIDYNSILGWILLLCIFVTYLYLNPPENETQDQKELTKNENHFSTSSVNDSIYKDKYNILSDSLNLVQDQKKMGYFAYNSTIGIDKDGVSTIENELLRITIENKGGQVKEVLLKKYTKYNKEPLYLVKDKNASFGLSFATSDYRNISTDNLLFEPTLENKGTNHQVLSLKSKTDSNSYLEYRYEIKPNDYRVDFTIRTQAMEDVFDSEKPIELIWLVNGISNEKSISYENLNTALYYQTNSGDVKDLSVNKSDDKKVDDVNWVAYKQHFFSSILYSQSPFNSVEIATNSLVKDVEIDTAFTKSFALKTYLPLKGGELNYNMNWFYGPNKYKLLKSYNNNYSEIIELGWGIFGWINKILFIPVFNALEGIMVNYGFIIILMTIIVRIIMSPLVYKSYLSSAKMKVLRPEIETINKDFPGKSNAMKRQQEMMALYRKTGVNPMAGCIPAILQMPIFFALFRFFPATFDLRQKKFLWAEDLSAYDSILQLPFTIPFYGDHISLFPILAGAAIFLYMNSMQGQQSNMQPAQEGMPDMQKMMKIMLYISPFFMIVFFNNYASSLSLYYFISNMLTLIIMIIIKKFIISESNIQYQIQENKKKKPAKQSKFRANLERAIKKAQEIQEEKKKNN